MDVSSKEEYVEQFAETVKVESPLLSATSMIHKSLGAMEQTLDELVAKLTPILGSGSPQLVEDGRFEVDAFGDSVALRSLGEARNLIDQMNRRIISLMDRIET